MDGTDEIDDKQDRVAQRVVKVAVVAISCLILVGCYSGRKRELSYLEGKFDQLNLDYSSKLRQQRRFLKRNLSMPQQQWWAKMNNLQERVDFLQKTKKRAEAQVRQKLGSNASDAIDDLGDKLTKAATKEEIEQIIREVLKDYGISNRKGTEGGGDKKTANGERGTGTQHHAERQRHPVDGNGSGDKGRRGNDNLNGEKGEASQGDTTDTGSEEKSSEVKKIVKSAESEGADVPGYSEIISWIKQASTPQQARQRLEWWKRYVKQWWRVDRLSKSGNEETKEEAEKQKKKMRQTRPGESNLGDTKKEIDLLDEKDGYLDKLYNVRDKYMDTFQKMGRSKDLNRRVEDISDNIRDAATMNQLKKAAKGIKKLRNWIDGEMERIPDHVGPDDVTQMEKWDPDEVTVVEEPREVAVREVGEYKMDLTDYGIKQPQALLGETRAEIFLADPGNGTIQPAIVKGSTVDREHDFKIEMVGPDNKWSKNEKVFRMRVTGADKKSSIDVKRWLALSRKKGKKTIKGQILNRTEGRLSLPPGAYYLLATGQTDWGNSFGVIYQVEVPQPPVTRDED